MLPTPRVWPILTDRTNVDHDSKTDAPVQRTSGVKFGLIDPQVVRDPTLPMAVKVLYSYLATFCNSSRSSFPSRQRMAEEIGISIRTIDSAVKTGSAVGLWTVEKRQDQAGRQTSNLYLLHDFGGGYLARGEEFAPLVEDVAPEPGVSNSAPSHRAESAPEQYNSSISTKRFTCGHRERRSPRKFGQIFLTKDFHAMEDGPAANHIIRCVLRIFETKGFDAEPDAGDIMGRRLTKLATEHCLDRDELVEAAQTWAETGEFYDEDDEEWVLLATPPDEQGAA